MHVQQERLSPLGELKWHYGSAYELWHRDGTWFAERRDTREGLSASSPEGLFELLRLDYAEHPVPR